MWIAGPEPAGQKDAGDARADAREEENQQSDAPDLNTGPTRIFLVRTSRSNMQPETRPGHQIVSKDPERRHQKERDRNANHRASGEPDEGGGDPTDALVGIGENEALQRAQHSEGQDEWMDLQPAVQKAVSQSDDRTGQYAKRQRGES